VAHTVKSQSESRNSGRSGCPTVSVIIAVYNRADTVARAINSALAQNYPGPVEIVVADDGSTDGTRAVLERYGAQITIHRLPHRGVAAARNAAARASQGELLAFLDSDDYWMPEKLTRTVTPLIKDPTCVLAYHDGFESDPSGAVVRRSMYPDDHRDTPSLENLISAVWPGLPILFDSVVVRREIFDRVGGINELLESGEDAWFLMNARELGKFCYVAEPLMVREKGASPWREEWYIAGATKLRELVEQRYGTAVVSHILESVLRWSGREALRRGERSLARQRCWAAARQPRAAVRTWLVLAMTFLPLRLIRMIESTKLGRAIP
jgi:glycosyltransferase involved in cell wall biosynthesis